MKHNKVDHSKASVSSTIMASANCCSDSRDIGRNAIQVMQYPTCSPDLAPSDFQLFSALKEAPGGKRLR
jgi:hypothetical protein